MLKQMVRHAGWCVLAVLVLGACETSAVAPAGYFEVTGALGRGAVCDAEGDLRLEGLEAPALVLVSGGELCAGVPVRRELPPGLYALSWQSAEHSRALDAREPSQLRGPTVVSLWPGQLTRLRVRVEATSPPAISVATASSDVGAGRPAPPSACGQGPRLTGAS